MKHGELHPLLAAGVPTYRICLPFVAGMLAVNGIMFANGELIIPRIANQLQINKSESSDESLDVDSQYDPQTWIHISGSALKLAERTLVRRSSCSPAQPWSIISRQSPRNPRGTTGSERGSRPGGSSNGPLRPLRRSG